MAPRREPVGIRKFQGDLWTAIFQHHAPGLVAELPLEIGDWQRRGRKQPKLLHQLLDDGAPSRLLFICQGILDGVIGLLIPLSGGRIAPQLRATAGADSSSLPERRRQAHDNTVFDILDTLAGDQDQRDILFQAAGRGRRASAARPADTDRPPFHPRRTAPCGVDRSRAPSMTLPGVLNSSSPRPCLWHGRFRHRRAPRLFSRTETSCRG